MQLTMVDVNMSLRLFAYLTVSITILSLITNNSVNCYSLRKSERSARQILEQGLDLVDNFNKNSSQTNNTLATKPVVETNKISSKINQTFAEQLKLSNTIQDDIIEKNLTENTITETTTDLSETLATTTIENEAKDLFKSIPIDSQVNLNTESNNDGYSTTVINADENTAHTTTTQTNENPSNNLIAEESANGLANMKITTLSGGKMGETLEDTTTQVYLKESKQEKRTPMGKESNTEYESQTVTEKVAEANNSVHSMRGGYLNLAPTSTSPSPQSSAETDAITTTKKPVTSKALWDSEDARFEEMLSETMSRNNKEYEFNRLKNDSTSDELTVKPISKNLYTVNPNYKPMKKIEVVASKQQVRDPDDVSWRNESLSNLGIVFKANNSSKPLTQVLKNKTENELKKNENKTKQELDGENIFSVLSNPYDHSKEVVEKTKNQNKTLDVDHNHAEIYIENGEDYGFDYANPLEILKDNTRIVKTTTYAPSTEKPTFPERKPTVEYFPPLPKKTTVVTPPAFDYEQVSNPYMYKEEKPKGPSYDMMYVDTPSTKPKTRNLNKFRGRIENSVPSPDDYEVDTAEKIINQHRKIYENKYGLKTANKFQHFPTNPIEDLTYVVDDDDIRPKQKQFHRNFKPEILQTFINNFNQNNDKFQVDYPVIYNNSVVHNVEKENGRVLAASIAFVKQSYGTSTKIPSFLEHTRAYYPKGTVIPAEYSIDYFIAEQEEQALPENG